VEAAILNKNYRKIFLSLSSSPIIESIPDDAFMILWLDKSKMNRVSGLAKYRDEFNTI
jgi:hypothetical protein